MNGSFFIKRAWLLVSLIFTACIIFSGNLPVFWDMYGQVKMASFFLENPSFQLIPSGDAYSDNGHAPLYPLYLALCFKIFGFHLWVAHYSVLPFVFGIMWQLQKLCVRFLSEKSTALVLLFTLFLPAFLTQTIYFSQELSLVFASLYAINAMYDDKPLHVALSSVLLCLLNLRGIVLCITLLFYFRKKRSKFFLLGGIIAWIAWLCIHDSLSGWWFYDERIGEYRGVASLERMWNNFLVCLWKPVDLGAVFGWAAVLIVSVRKKSLTEPVRLLLLASLSVFVLCVPFTNPVNARYFLLVYVLLLPAFASVLPVLPNKMAVTASIAFAIVLFANNGVTYPDRYGNAWDCSLKSLSYFGLRDELDAFVDANGINPGQVAAGFQVYFKDKYYRMNGGTREYALLSDTEMPAAEYVADSNIPNNFNEERNVFLMRNYVLLKEFRSGAVYIRLLKRSGF